MNTSESLPTLFFETQPEWEAWLRENHAGAAGVWLKLAKKGSSLVSIDLRRAQESAMCYGWVDSRAAPFDERFWLIKFTPRGPHSRWSRGNRAKAESLIDQGKMQPAGLFQVKQAKADGRWDA